MTESKKAIHQGACILMAGSFTTHAMTVDDAVKLSKEIFRQTSSAEMLDPLESKMEALSILEGMKERKEGLSKLEPEE